MAYLWRQEFPEAAREGKLGTLLWPEWHYGVLLLYGQHLGLNHLMATNQLNVIKLQNHLDYPSGNNQSVFSMIHIHVFHGEMFFSKQMFKIGKYDKMLNQTREIQNLNKVAFYACRMALEGKFFKNELLAEMLQKVNGKKT